MTALTETHRRAIKAIAIMVERKLEEMENCLLRKAITSRSVNIYHQIDLSADEVKNIQESLDVLYKLLGEFCNYYQTPKEQWSIRKELQVKTGFLWEELSDATSRKFYGYGEEGKTIKAEYVRRISEMIAITNIIYQSIR